MVRLVVVILFSLAIFLLFSGGSAWASVEPDAALSAVEGCGIRSTGYFDPSVVNSYRACAPARADSPVAEYARAAQVNAASSQYHVVAGSDTLYGIAERYHLSLAELLLANPEITDPNLIYDNQKVLIPTQADLERMRSAEEQRGEEERRRLAQKFAQDNSRWIEVDLQHQVVRVYDQELVVKTFTVSTGTAAFPTVTGEFRIWIKLKSQNMSGPGYFLEDVPYVMYFYEDYALHGTYWHSNFGTPMSHGCVNLRTEDAQWLYDFAEVGTLVYVH